MVSIFVVVTLLAQAVWTPTVVYSEQAVFIALSNLIAQGHLVAICEKAGTICDVCEVHSRMCLPSDLC